MHRRPPLLEKNSSEREELTSEKSASENLTWLFGSEMGLCEVKGNRLLVLDSSATRKEIRAHQLIQHLLVFLGCDKWFKAAESNSEEKDEARLRNLFLSSCWKVGCHRRLSRISNENQTYRRWSKSDRESDSYTRRRLAIQLVPMNIVRRAQFDIFTNTMRVRMSNEITVPVVCHRRTHRRHI